MAVMYICPNTFGSIVCHCLILKQKSLTLADDATFLLKKQDFKTQYMIRLLLEVDGFCSIAVFIFVIRFTSLFDLYCSGVYIHCYYQSGDWMGSLRYWRLVIGCHDFGPRVGH